MTYDIVLENKLWKYIHNYRYRDYTCLSQYVHNKK